MPMLITLTCHAPNAADIGYLLAKNPASVFAREFSAGRVWVFYPEVAAHHLTIALLTEIDMVGLMRGPTALAELGQNNKKHTDWEVCITSVAATYVFPST